METVKSNHLEIIVIEHMEIVKFECREKLKFELPESTENKVLAEFANRLGVTPKQILEPNKSPHMTEIRYLYCKLRHEKHGLTFTAAGREIGRSPATVSQGVRHINNLIGFDDKKLIEMWNKVLNIQELAP